MSAGEDNEYEIDYNKPTSEYIKPTSEHIKSFLESYCTPSFGALSGKEVQLLVFKLFLDLELIKLEESDYVIARKLRIEPSKVKTLRFNYKLRYGKVDSKIIKKILQESKSITEKADYKEEYIRLKITDQLVRAHIIDQLYKINCIYDYGRNKDIIKLGVVDFFNWLQEYGYADEKKLKDALRKKLSNEELKQKDIEHKTVKESIKHLIKDAKAPEKWVYIISVAIKALI